MGKLRTVYISSSVDEALRYSYDDWSFQVIPYNNCFIFFTNLLILLRAEVVIVNGYRAPDRCIIDLLIGLKVNIHVVQHGSNENFSLSKSSLRLILLKIIPSLGQYINWGIVCVLCMSIRRLRKIWLYRVADERTVVKAFYFTENYKLLWEDFLKGKRILLSFTRCLPPSPMIWGVKNTTKRGAGATAFLIDEPFDQHTYLSHNKVTASVKDFVEKNNISKVLVKLHPRSKGEIFYSSPIFTIIDYVPISTKFLIAYKSNLIRAFNEETAEVFVEIVIDNDDHVTLKKGHLILSDTEKDLLDFSHLAREICGVADKYH